MSTSNATQLIGEWSAQGSPAVGEIRGVRVTATPKMPPRVIIDFAQKCNLRCGFCPVWGRDPLATEGLMGYQEALEIVRQLPAGTVVSPSWYGEPLLIPYMRPIFEEMKARGHVVNLNTNGLTLTAEIAAFWCSIGVDSVMFSLDAARPATLKLVRGIWALEKIEAAVWRLMTARGDRMLPRIGVSFTVQEKNAHDLADFKARWIGTVDVVRIGKEYRDGKFPDMATPAKRTPCALLYETMVIRNDGEVPICCLDSRGSQAMGNVRTDGVRGVWNGDFFENVRHFHETEQWDRLPFCRDCNGWADKGHYIEEERDGILIRRSPQYEFYNRIDKLASLRK